jgi:hypothetical protein
VKNEFEFDELDKKTQKRVIDWFRTDDIGVVEHILEAVKQFKFDSEGKIIKKIENPRSFSILKCDKCNEEFAVDEGFIGAITCPYCSKMFIPCRIKKIKIAKRKI